MRSTPENTPSTTATVRRVLAVADWGLDAQAVVDALKVRSRQGPSLFGLLVPARLYGLDWVGDPHAGRPCAELQLLELKRLCRVAGIPVEASRVGDPETAPAVGETLTDWPADEILLFSRRRRARLSHPLSLARRVERTSRRPVSPMSVPAATPSAPRARRRHGAPHCSTARTQTA